MARQPTNLSRGHKMAGSIGGSGNGGNTATLQHVATVCGVSLRTVSRVLKGTFKGTWPSMARRAETIRRTAAELGYRPNTAARAMRNGRFDCIGLLLGTDCYRSNLPPALLTGIHDGLAERSVHMIISRLPDPALTSEQHLPRLLEELAVDGVLIDYTHAIPAGLVRLVRKHALPAVWINSKQTADCVCPDDLAAGRIATEHLLQLGHSRVVYVSSLRGTGHYSVMDRRLGYEQAMRSAGRDPLLNVAGDAFRGPAESLQAYLVLLCQKRRPTAAVAYGPLDAGLMIRAADLLGLRVPQDISIVNIGGSQMEDLGIACTTVLIPENGMGQEAARMILRKAAAPAKPLAPVCLPVTLAEGATSAPPNGV